MRKVMATTLVVVAALTAACSPEVRRNWQQAREERRIRVCEEAKAELADARLPNAEWSVGSAVERQLAMSETGENLQAMADWNLWNCDEIE